MVILILGMMFGSGVASVVEILQYLSDEAALKSFVVWTMGSLGDVTGSQLALLLPSSRRASYSPSPSSNRSTCCCWAKITPGRWD